MTIAVDEAGFQLYGDLADHPELVDKTTKALLERPDVSGLTYMASYAESPAAFTAAAQPAGEPEANSKPLQEVCMQPVCFEGTDEAGYDVTRSEASAAAQSADQLHYMNVPGCPSLKDLGARTCR